MLLLLLLVVVVVGACKRLAEAAKSSLLPLESHARLSPAFWVGVVVQQPSHRARPHPPQHV